MRVQIVHDIVEENGQTIRENNLRKKHRIPIGALVEVRWDEWFGGGACWKVHARLWVVAHERDCDGTPLYGLSRWKHPEFAARIQDTHRGISEESLQAVEITKGLKDGYGALEWDPADD